jgi:hypothetical protein
MLSNFGDIQIYCMVVTCLMYYTNILKVTLRLLKIYFYIADAVEWSRVLDIRLSDWYCSVSMFQNYNVVQFRRYTDILYGCHLFNVLYKHVSRWQPYNISVPLYIRLSDWYCSVSMVWVQIPSREEHKFVSSISNSNTFIVFGLQYQSLSLMSSTLDHSTASAI